MTNKEKKGKKTKKIPTKHIQWEGPEYEYIKKSSDWLWITAIITISIFFASIMLNNVLFGLIALLGGFSITIHATKKPEIIKFKIGPRGIQIQNRFFSYNDLESFWIDHENREIHGNKARTELLIQPQKMVSSIITIPLIDSDIDEVEKYLTNFLTQEEIEKPFSSVIMNLLKI